MSWIEEQNPSAKAAIFAFWDDTYIHTYNFDMETAFDIPYFEKQNFSPQISTAVGSTPEE
jgi:hypothetical protein